MNLPEVVQNLRDQLGIGVDVSQVLLAYALLMARILPVIMFTPFLGGEAVPSEVKIGLGVMLGGVLYPTIIEQAANVNVSAVVFIALMLKELFIGLSIMFVVGMVFEAAQVAGSLIDTLSGITQAQLMVPQLQLNVSLFANLKIQLVTVVFVTLNGHHVVIEALAESLNMVPIDQLPRFSHGFWPFFELVLRVFGDLLRVALAMASPVLLATFLTDLALGMINRVAPQVQVFFVAMQIKPAVTGLVMLSAIHVILTRVVSEYGVMFNWLRQLLQLLK